MSRALEQRLSNAKPSGLYGLHNLDPVFVKTLQKITLSKNIPGSYRSSISGFRAKGLDPMSGAMSLELFTELRYEDVETVAATSADVFAAM